MSCTVSNCLSNIEFSLFNQLPGCWGCKDRHSVFRYANQDYAWLVGHRRPEDCIGLTDFDMPSPTVECAAEFQRQDQYVMESERTLKILDIHPYPDGRWHAHIFTKSPWYNDSGEVQGTIFYGQELTDTAVLEVGYWICRATGITDGNLPRFRFNDASLSISDLTAREQETLFLLLYGRKPQYIANIMGISIKTVEGHVARLRTKFAANSKNELIDKALEAGFGSLIPKSLLNTQLSVVLNGDHLSQ
ncbi:helix-turn-helix transcriptional regulator [Vibrio vulnificus]|nr:helix-turn-helix transcriptional regulator [Vibrio vulnificus]